MTFYKISAIVLSLNIENIKTSKKACDLKNGKSLLGITSLIATSDGNKVANPKHFKRLRQKLKRAQKALSRKQKGSNNRKKARLKVAKIHGKIADTRQDFLHKLTTELIRENQTIVVESLAILAVPRRGGCQALMVNLQCFGAIAIQPMQSD